MSLLDKARISAPCPVKWEEMQQNRGNAAVRFCLKCSRSVYDVASMSREEAEKLLRSEDPVCVQIVRREDGKVMTRDCGVPLPRRPGRPGHPADVLVSGPSFPAAMRGRLELIDEEPTPVEDVDERARSRERRKKRSIYEREDEDES